MKGRKNLRRSLLALLLAAALCVGSLPVWAQGSYNDYDEIVYTGIDLSTPKQLRIAQPQGGSASTTQSSYYISGNSNPNQSLTVNGQAVEYRGEQGTFGVKVDLQLGQNNFTIRNGDAVQTVTITRSQAPSVAKTTKLSSLSPSAKDYAFAGEYTLRCTAPSGALVSASIGGKTVELEQVAATAENGVPAIYKGTVELSADDEAVDYGAVTYFLTFQGQQSSATSAGSVTVYPQGATPTMEVNQNSTTVYEKNDLTSNFVAMLNEGARDRILELEGDMARLSLGGWVKKEFLTPVEGNPSVKNRISGYDFQREEGGETLTLYGSSPAAFKAYWNSEKLYLSLNQTSGLSSLRLKGSKLVSKVEVSTQNGNTVLELTWKDGDRILGYDVSYGDDGELYLYLNEKPKLSSGDQPLQGVTVVVDAGHGGYDPGAVGVLAGQGPVESRITLSHAIAVKQRLEKLGANVVMTVTPALSQNEKFILTQRVQKTRDAKADFFLSFHCNSVGGSANDLKSKGAEVYYYESVTQPLAQDLLQRLCDATGRDLRGCYYSNYFVTRNSLCPGLLLEMGFITNPQEYDELCHDDSLFATANAVADSLIAYLGGEA